MASKIDLPTINSGVEYSHSILFWVQNSAGVREPWDLTGYKARLQIRAEGPGSSVLADWGTPPDDVDGEIEVASGLVNEIRIWVGSSKTKGLTFEEKDYDLLVWPDGDKERASLMCFGVVSAGPTVTEVPV